MGPIWFLFVASVALLVGVAWSLLFRLRGRPSPMWNDPNVPVWADLTVGFFGSVVMVSTVPGLFFGEPSWAIDHLYRAISKVL